MRLSKVKGNKYYIVEGNRRRASVGHSFLTKVWSFTPYAPYNCRLTDNTNYNSAEEAFEGFRKFAWREDDYTRANSFAVHKWKMQEGDYDYEPDTDSEEE